MNRIEYECSMQSLAVKVRQNLRRFAKATVGNNLNGASRLLQGNKFLSHFYSLLFHAALLFYTIHIYLFEVPHC